MQARKVDTPKGKARFKGHAWSQKGTKAQRRAAREQQHKRNEEPEVYYAVAVGENPGVYTKWSAAAKQVVGFSGAVHKMFKTLEGARQFMTAHYLKVNRCVPPPIATVSYVRDEYTNYDTSALSAQSFQCIAQMAFLISTGRFAETAALDVSHCRCPSCPYEYGDYKLQRIALLHRLYRLNKEDTDSTL